MIRDLLVACDFSDSSARALAYGVDLVERTGGILHFTYVQEVSMGPFVGGEPSPERGDRRLRARFEERCRDELLEACSFTPDDEHLSFEAQRSGAVAPTLVRLAEERDVDLIVMGTQGRRGVQRALFGSVAEEVLRTAPCPVLTTRAPDGEETGGPPEAVDVERIVVPLDFSESSRSALRYAARLAPVYEAPLTLVHAIQLPSIPTAYELELSGLSPQGLEERVRDELQEWAGTVSVEQGISYVVESGDAVPTILGVASASSDLVVTSTRGRSGVKRTMLGSVAEGVIRRAPGPVISARSFPEEE